MLALCCAAGVQVARHCRAGPTCPLTFAPTRFLPLLLQGHKLAAQYDQHPKEEERTLEFKQASPGLACACWGAQYTCSCLSAGKE